MKINFRGFTLMELLIVIAIIGILTTLSTFALQGARKQGRDARRKSDLETIRSGLELYKADCNVYPATSTVTGDAEINGNTSPCSVGSSNIYIKKVPKDPSGTNYTYNRTTTTSYTLCATLEDDTTGGTCNYKVTNP